MHQKLFKYSLFCFVGTMSVACSKIPEGILSQKQMVAVQVDMMKAQTLCNIDKDNLPDKEHCESLYRSVFEKHGITQALYDSSLVWYGRNLEIYMKVCDKIYAEISKEQKALGDIQAADLTDAKQDSVDIWPRQPFMKIENNSIFTGTTFNIKPSKSYPSGSTFIFKTSVWGLNDKMKNYPKVCMTAVQPDTVVTVSAPINKDGVFTLELHTVPTKKVKSVYGYIYLNNQESEKYNKIYLDDIELMRFNYGHVLKTQIKPIEVKK